MHSNPLQKDMNQIMLLELEEALIGEDKAVAILKSAKDFVESGVCDNPLKALLGHHYRNSKKAFQEYLIDKAGGSSAKVGTARVKASMLNKASEALIPIKHKFARFNSQSILKAATIEPMNIDELKKLTELHDIYNALGEHYFPDLTYRDKDAAFSVITQDCLSKNHFARVREKRIKNFTTKTHGKAAENIINGWTKVEAHFSLPEGLITRFIPKMIHISQRKSCPNGTKKPSELLDLGKNAEKHFMTLASYFMQPMTVDEILETHHHMQLANNFLSTAQFKSPKKYWSTNGRGDTPTVEIWRNILRNFSTTFVKCGLIQSIEEFDFSMLLNGRNLQLFYDYHTNGIWVNSHNDIINQAEYNQRRALKVKGIVEYEFLGGDNHKQAKKCLMKLLVLIKSPNISLVPYLPMFYFIPSSPAKNLQEYCFDISKLVSKVEGLITLVNSSGEANPSDGNRNIKWLIDTSYRANKGLQGGVEDGVIEYQKIVRKFEELAYEPCSNGDDRLRYLSIALAMRIALVNPLRISNFEDLIAEPYRTVEEAANSKAAALISNADDSYSTFIPLPLVKNRAHLGKHAKGIENKLPIALSDKINEFIEQRALHYHGMDNRLFIWNGINSRGGLRINMSEQTYRVIQLIWPERDWIVKGINPHALRHFAATYYLSKNRQDYAGLSILLNDKEETVRSVYAKLDLHSIQEDIMRHGEVCCNF